MSAQKKKVVASSPSTGNKAGSKAPQQLTPLEQLLQEILHWRACRQRTLPLVRDIVNLRNQSSHVGASKVSQAFGAAVKPSRMTLQLHDSLTGRIKELSEAQDEMLQSLERAAALLTGLPPSDAPGEREGGEGQLDRAFAQRVLECINQQMLLELCAAETLTMTGSGEAARALSSWEDDVSLDPDVAATLLVCFSHPPYLPQSVDFERLAAL